VSPAQAQWGTRAHLVLSGGSDLAGKTFTVKLGYDNEALTDCTSATVDPTDPSRLELVCDIPPGSPHHSLPLEVYWEDLRVAGVMLPLDWPPEAGPASFEGRASAFVTWGTPDGRLTVSGGVNLAGHPLTATLGGLPCSGVALTSEDPGSLELTCPTPPGHTQGSLPLVIQEHGATVPGGEVEVEAVACHAAVALTSGVPLPLLCDVPAGSTAAVSSGLEGIWSGDGVAVFSPDGRFMARSGTRWNGSGWSPPEDRAGDWTASGSTWTPSNAEHHVGDTFEPFTESGPYVPFTSLGLMGSPGKYLSANALLVSQAGDPGTVGVAGTWGSSAADLALTVDPSGAFTGTLHGSCAIAGTLTVLEPPKNVLSIVLRASGGEACDVWQAGELTGLGYVDVYRVEKTYWPSETYRLDLDLVLLLRTPGQYYLEASAVQH
jgi:hypothetical protein